jgi:hypothetical protein
MQKFKCVMVAVILFALIAGSSLIAGENQNAPQNQLTKCSSSTPVFIKNLGQWDSRVEYRASVDQATIWVTGNGLVYQFVRLNHESEQDYEIWERERTGPESEDFEQLVVRISFPGSNAAAHVAGEGQLDYTCNYLKGNDPLLWQRNVPGFKSVRFEEMYQGIDMIYYGNGERLEYDFIVKPGSDLSQIALKYEGINSPIIDQEGRLKIETAWGSYYEESPVVYQLSQGNKIRIGSKYRLLSENSFGFELDENYNPDIELIIDPGVILSYSTYIGGGDTDEGQGVGVDNSGYASIVGYTLSSDFPTAVGYDPSYNGDWDVFVSKFVPSGDALVFSTFLGGSQDDRGYAIDVDSNDHIFITGYTYSSDFPVSEAWDATYNLNGDVFVTNLYPDGTDLKYSTYLGGGGTEMAFGLDLEPSPTGVVYVTGMTGGAFPTLHAYQSSPGGGIDAFVSIFNADGILTRSTYYGGSGYDRGEDIDGKVDHLFTITGVTESTDLPVGNNYYDNTFNGGYRDAFVAYFSSTTLRFTSYIGGSDDDYGYGVTVDDEFHIFVTGSTESSDMYTYNAYDDSYNGGSDVFLTRFNGYVLGFSTYYGGSGNDYAFDIDANFQSDVYITGLTYSTDFPTDHPTYDSYNGVGDVFLSRFFFSGMPASFGIYFGGTEVDYGNAVKVRNLFDMYVTGVTESPDFHTRNAYDDTFNEGVSDAFLFKFGELVYMCGDANNDQSVNVSDAVSIINYVFVGGMPPNPIESGDCNCDSTCNVSDAVAIINYVFVGGYTPCDPDNDGDPDC